MPASQDPFVFPASQHSKHGAGKAKPAMRKASMVHNPIHQKVTKKRKMTCRATSGGRMPSTISIAALRRSGRLHKMQE